MTHSAIYQLSRHIFGLAVLLFAVGLLPYVYAWTTTPEGYVYTGLMLDVPDHAQYWSWVTASRDGFFISNTMTPEPNPPIFSNPMMWLLARIQVGLDLSFAQLFQVWRALAALILVTGVVAAARTFVRDGDRRRTAILVTLLGAGFGWALVIAKYAFRLSDVPFPNDVYVVEANAFLSSVGYPYIAQAQGLVLLILASVVTAVRRKEAIWFILAGLFSALLAASHPYDLITIYGVLAAYWLVLMFQRRSVPTLLTIASVVVGICSAPLAAFYWNLTSRDALWRSLLDQYANAGVWTPPHIHLVVLMGFPLLLAMLSQRRPTTLDDGRVFVAVWALVGLGLIYIPAVFQIKLLTAWQFPVAILAAYVWHDRFLPWAQLRVARFRNWAPLRPEVAATVLLTLLVLPTNLYLYAWRFVELKRHQAPFFLHVDEVAALQWLAEHAEPTDVAMAPLQLGQFIPNYGRTRAFLAHWAMTNKFFLRREQVDRFFRVETSDDERHRILDDGGVTLVVTSVASASQKSLHPSGGSPILSPVFVRPFAAVYRVRSMTVADASAVRTVE